MSTRVLGFHKNQKKCKCGHVASAHRSHTRQPKCFYWPRCTCTEFRMREPRTVKKEQ